MGCLRRNVLNEVPEYATPHIGAWRIVSAPESCLWQRNLREGQCAYRLLRIISNRPGDYFELGAQSGEADYATAFQN